MTIKVIVNVFNDNLPAGCGAPSHHDKQIPLASLKEITSITIQILFSYPKWVIADLASSVNSLHRHWTLHRTRARRG